MIADAVPFPTRYNMIGLTWSLDDFKKLYRSQAGGLTRVFHNVLTKNLKKESNALFSTEEVGAEAVSSSVSPVRMFHLEMELCHSWKLSLFLSELKTFFYQVCPVTQTFPFGIEPKNEATWLIKVIS